MARDLVNTDNRLPLFGGAEVSKRRGLVYRLPTSNIPGEVFQPVWRAEFEGAAGSLLGAPLDVGTGVWTAVSVGATIARNGFGNGLIQGHVAVHLGNALESLAAVEVEMRYPSGSPYGQILVAVVPTASIATPSTASAAGIAVDNIFLLEMLGAIRSSVVSFSPTRSVQFTGDTWITKARLGDTFRQFRRPLASESGFFNVNNSGGATNLPFASAMSILLYGEYDFPLEYIEVRGLP